MKQSVIFVLFNCFHIYYVYSSNLPGPLVYVVTPASKIPQWKDGARTAPFYYSNWMKRMDTPSSSTPVTTTEGRKTPDLIFAEFESDNSNMKSIRKLLEKENIDVHSTTTISQPIYVPEEETASESDNDFIQSSTEEPKKVDMTDYFALYNNLYNTGAVYVPNTPSTTVSPPTSTYTTTTTTTEQPMNNVESVWHIIDNRKQDEYSSKWQETAINSEDKDNDLLIPSNEQNDKEISNENESLNDNGIDENFALPGFGTNAGNGGENESRAIRTESNIRFPYVNLKPFMMKNSKTKNVNNMFNLDSFTEIKNPVRGEAQDNPMVTIRQPIDRYNPAQPYLPEYGIGVKSKPKQYSAPAPAPIAAPQPPPTKAVANLVPPPPPAPPKLTADDFPTPSTYESFPPYAPNGPGPGSVFSFPSSDLGSDSSDSDGPPSGPPSGPPTGYRYKPPSPPAAVAPSAPPFVPTLPPLSKPFAGYSYNKPPMAQDGSPPAMDMDDKPDFQGYQYSKPMLGFSYDKPPSTQGDSPPAMDTKDKPDFHSYSNPAPSEDHHSPGYGYHDAPPPSYHPESDYPDLIYDKPHGMSDMKGGNDMKASDMGMMPPPPPPADSKPDSYDPPMDDHGFPHDFPGDFKYAHDFDDHDYHHHHHHTTTTTTTEMPRVNRYSYYYLGKKLYYLPLYFSVYFVVYVGALIIKAVLRHKITYPNSFRPGNDPTASFFSKRSIDSHLTNENLHEITGRVTRAIATAAEKYVADKSKDQ